MKLGIIFSLTALAISQLSGGMKPVTADTVREALEAHIPQTETKLDAFDPENAWLTPVYEKAVIEPEEIIVEEEVSEPEEIVVEEAVKEEPSWVYFGNCTITHYDNGPCCCGPWAYGNTASGVPPTAGRTVAHNYLPFGTRVLINGCEYVVEDRGDANMASGMWFDVYVSSHDEANARGMFSTDVYIMEG